MSKIEPFDLAPLVGFATWHLEHKASTEKVFELLRRHKAYCQFSDEALRKVVRRALSDLKHWQRIRHCCGYTAEGGCCSWDEAEQEMTREQSGAQPDASGDSDRRGDGTAPGGWRAHRHQGPDVGAGH